MKGFLAFVAVSMGALAGCAVATEVMVGETPAELDLGQCFGKGTVCAPSDVTQKRLVTPEIRSLEVSGSRSVTLDWRVDFDGGPFLLGMPYGVYQLAVAPDGTVWVAGAAERGAFVAQYDGQGKLLGRTEIALDELPDFGDLMALMLAVDSAGVVHVGYSVSVFVERLGWHAQHQLWLGRYTAGAKASGELIRIQGVVKNLLPGLGLIRIAAGADGALLIVAAGEDQANVMGRLDPDGNRRWIQSLVRQSVVSALVGDAQGRTVVMGANLGPRQESVTTSLAMYDHRGNMLWDREPLYFLEDGGGIAAHPAGELILARSMYFDLPGVPPPDGGPTLDAVLHRIDGLGRVLSATRLVQSEADFEADPRGTAPKMTPPSVDAAGRIYFGANERSIYVVNADGDDYARLELQTTEDGAEIIDVRVGAGGELFVALRSAPVPWSIARIRL